MKLNRAYQMAKIAYDINLHLPDKEADIVGETGSEMENDQSRREGKCKLWRRRRRKREENEAEQRKLRRLKSHRSAAPAKMKAAAARRNASRES